MNCVAVERRVSWFILILFLWVFYGGSLSFAQETSAYGDEGENYGAGSGAASSQLPTQYIYDDLGRLKQVIEPVTGSGNKVTSYSYDAAGNRTFMDLPTVISIEPAVSVDEGQTIMLPVYRHGDLGGQSTANFTTVDDSAVSGADYVAVSGTVIFAIGESEKLIEIETVADQVIEPQEAFLVRLTNVTGAVTAVVEAQGIINNIETP